MGRRDPSRKETYVRLRLPAEHELLRAEFRDPVIGAIESRVPNRAAGGRVLIGGQIAADYNSDPPPPKIDERVTCWEGPYFLTYSQAPALGR